MLKGIDHLIVLVPNLDEGIRAYEDLGFTVTRGGEHPTFGSHNALIPFADDSYIELFCFKQPEQPREMRWWTYVASGGGLIDFALITDDMEADTASLSKRVMPYSMSEGKRGRPDGQEVAWKMGLPPGWRSATPSTWPAVPVPFLVEDVTPRSLRVPTGDARHHANGVVGVERIYAGAPDLAAARAPFSALLEEEPRTVRDSLLGDAETLSYTCGSSQVALLDRVQMMDRLPAGAPKREAGILAAVLRLENERAGRWLDPVQAKGAAFYLAPGR